MMKTFAVKLKQTTVIEGTEYPANFHVGALTSEVGPLTLLGLVQYKHATLEEIVDGPDENDSETEDTSEDGIDGLDSDGDSADEGDAAGDAKAAEADKTPSGITSFLAAGLDQKTAEALVVANNIASVDELKLLMADPDFDLVDLEDIGTVRAEKIKAVFSK